MSRIFKYLIFIGVLFLILATATAVNRLFLSSSSTTQTNFITRSGTQLMLNGQPFRFAGANMYWLGLDENVGEGEAGSYSPPVKT